MMNHGVQESGPGQEFGISESMLCTWLSARTCGNVASTAVSNRHNLCLLLAGISNID